MESSLHFNKLHSIIQLEILVVVYGNNTRRIDREVM